MNSLEEFEFWCGEYRDNPDIAPSETQRLLKKMCEDNNPYALKHFQEMQGTQSGRAWHETELVEMLSRDLAVDDQSCSVNVDDLDGNDWGARIGAINPELVSAGLLSPVPDPSKADYPLDWAEVSTAMKNLRGWRCGHCGYQKLYSGLIQVHHVDGDKLDSHPANLEVLCAKCHADKHRTSVLWPYGVTEDEKEELNRHHAVRRHRR